MTAAAPRRPLRRALAPFAWSVVAAAALVWLYVWIGVL